MNKTFVIVLVVLLLVSCVSAFTIKYSNPSVGNPEPILKSNTTPCSNEEWNNYFEDYRNGLVNKEDTLTKLRNCDRW